MYVLLIYIETSFIPNMKRNKDIKSYWYFYIYYFCTFLYIPEIVIIILRLVWNLYNTMYIFIVLRLCCKAYVFQDFIHKLLCYCCVLWYSIFDLGNRSIFWSDDPTWDIINKDTIYSTLYNKYIVIFCINNTPWNKENYVLTLLTNNWKVCPYDT